MKKIDMAMIGAAAIVYNLATAACMLCVGCYLLCKALLPDIKRAAYAVGIIIVSLLLSIPDAM